VVDVAAAVAVAAEERDVAALDRRGNPPLGSRAPRLLLTIKQRSDSKVEESRAIEGLKVPEVRAGEESRVPCFLSVCCVIICVQKSFCFVFISNL